MFGNGKALRAQNEDLKNQVASLHDRISGIEQSSTYALAQGLESDIAAIANDDGMNMVDVAAAQDAAIEARKAKLIKKLTNEMVDEKVAAALAAARDEIRAEASQAAAAMAVDAVAEFKLHKADAYRAEIRDRLARSATATGIAVAKHTILIAEQPDVSQVSDAQLPVPKPETSQELKQRVKALRERTSRTNVLPFSWLHDDDVITIGFTDSGKGFEALTTTGYYESDRQYRSDLERRKLSVRLTDRDNGIGEIVADSWLAEAENRAQALRAGREVVVMAEDHTIQKVEPQLIQGEPVMLHDLSGQALATEQLAVWWVNVNKFRALS